MRHTGFGADVVLGLDVGAHMLTVVVSGMDLEPCEIIEWPTPRYTSYAVDPLQNPWVLLDVVLSALREAVGICEVFGSRIMAVSITVGMYSLLALDDDDRPLTPVVNYTDRRSRNIAQVIAADHGDELHGLTGAPISPSSPVTKLAWFGAHDRELFEQAACWSGLKGFLSAQLTGRLIGDTSTWSANGMVDSRTLDWSPAALDLVGLNPGQLPELADPTMQTRLLASVTDYLGLPAGTPLIVGASGAAVTHLGMGVMGRDHLALSMSGSAALSVLDTEPMLLGSELFSYHSFADGLWMTRGAFSNGEAVARWAAESFGGVDIDVLLAEAEQVPVGAHGLIGIPHQSEDWLPWWNPDFHAALVGLRVEHGRAAMTRAMVEGVARQLAMVRDEMLPNGRATSPIRASGPALRSPLWGSLLASALDSPLEIVHGTAAPALGAAVMAWRGLGRISSLTEGIDIRPPTRLVLPDPLATAHFAAIRPLAEQLTHLLTQLRAVA